MQFPGNFISVTLRWRLLAARRQISAKQQNGFARLHRVYFYLLSLFGQDVEVARRDQAGAARAALYERLQVFPVPRIVNHDQEVAVGQQLFQLVNRQA